MNDKINNIQGHIIVECLDLNKNVLDRYENKNLIMDLSRTSMVNFIADLSSKAPINKLVLGTKGHIDGDLTTPKTELEGFISSRTELFSEEALEFNYPILFTVPGTTSGVCIITSEPDTDSTINIDVTGTEVQYTIEIPETAGNDVGVVMYTEAALYAGDNIFSMKCFPAKLKDNTVTLRIIWKIIF